MLLMPAIAEEMTLPPKGQGDVVATVSIRVAEQTPLPGTARVRVRIEVQGPADLRVELQPLEDALAAWRVPRRASSVRSNGRAEWECTLELVQVKPGVVPLPGVRIRVHSGGVPQYIAWPELLNEPADVAPLVEVAALPPSPWPDRLRWVCLLALALVGMVGIVLGVRRWVTRPARPLPPLEAAVAAIDRLSKSPDEPTRLIAELDGVLRAYLETRGVAATRMTGRELRGPLQAIPGGAEISDLLMRGEELKFAGVGVTSTQALHLASRSREVLLAIVEKEGARG